MVTLTLALIVCLGGLVMYVLSTEKTLAQLLEDIGRILFATGALAVLIVWATKTIYP